jgi:hypothetical protein
MLEYDPKCESTSLLSDEKLFVYKAVTVFGMRGRYMGGREIVGTCDFRFMVKKKS